MNNKKKKLLIVASAATISVIALGSIAAWLLGAFDTAEKRVPIPDTKKQQAPEIMQFVRSEKFARLPMISKVDYVKSIDPKKRHELFSSMRNMSKDERDKLRKTMRGVFRRIMRERVKKYFSSSREEQNKMLDEMIARRKEWRARRAARRGSSRRRRPQRSQTERVKRQKQFLSRTDSETRAQFTEIMRAAREREAGKR